MRIKLSLGIAAMLLSVAPQLYAQSLADLARHESERRKAAPKTGGAKIYTNSDLKPVYQPEAAQNASDPPAPGGASAVSADAGKTAAAGDAKPAEVKDEAYWRKRTRDLSAKLEEDRILADALQSRVNALTMDFVNRDNPVERSRIEIDRQRALVELERLNKAVTADQKAIKELEEEVRAAGVTPGWLR